MRTNIPIRKLLEHFHERELYFCLLHIFYQGMHVGGYESLMKKIRDTGGGVCLLLSVTIYPLVGTEMLNTGRFTSFTGY